MPGKRTAPGGAGGVPTSPFACLIPTTGLGGFGGATGLLCVLGAGDADLVPFVEALCSTGAGLRAGSGGGDSLSVVLPGTGDVLVR